MAEMRRQRARNDQRVAALVEECPGLLSVESAALRLLLSSNTVRAAVKRGTVALRDHRLYPR
jgi:hypothetical protein